jgi:alkanesulfonate monooxygenase
MAAYTRLVLDLLAGDGAVTVDDEYHQVTNLRLQPPLPEELMPGVLVSGSSPAGLAAAHALGATPVKYPHPPGDEQASDSDEDFGVRVGIVARDTTDEAWQVALERFPEDRAGQITHKLAMKVSDSHWHHQLSGRAESSDRAGSERDGSGRQGREGRLTPYWLGPFRNYRTFCPYLVGDHETVGDYLAHYRRLGASTFIFDVPPSREELGHVEAALALADKQLANEQIDARGEAVT